MEERSQMQGIVTNVYNSSYSRGRTRGNHEAQEFAASIINTTEPHLSNYVTMEKMTRNKSIKTSVF